MLVVIGVYFRYLICLVLAGALLPAKKLTWHSLR